MTSQGVQKRKVINGLNSQKTKYCMKEIIEMLFKTID